MPNKLSSITKAEILEALDFIDHNGIPKDNEWNQYWIMYNRIPYPFKHSVHLASKFKIDFRSDHFYRTRISELGFNIQFKSEKGKDKAPKFWIGASYFGESPNHIPMLEDFIKNSYWATDHDFSSKTGKTIDKRLSQVSINDRIAIRFFSRKNSTIAIAALGTVKSIDEIHNGHLEVIWDYFPKLYNGPKPSGQGAGNWWNTFLEISRPEDIELIFDHEITNKRLSRLTWNLEHGYMSPSGRQGKSKDLKSHEGQFGYGHEEWLFDNAKLIDGYHYGFLEPVRKYQKFHTGKIYDVTFYTLDADSSIRYEVGEVYGLEVIDEQLADSIKQQYKTNGWLQEMEQQIIACGANDNGFSGFNGIDIFNVRYRPENLRINSPYKAIPKENAIYSAQRYTFIQDTSFSLNIEEEEEQFIFITPFPPSSNDGKDTNEDTGQPKRKKSFRKPKEVEIVYLHDAISIALTQKIRGIHQHQNVHPEHPAGYGQHRIDIVVNTNQGLVFYEIKTYPSILTAIREAFGQLMEYSYWSKHNRAVKIIIVTQIPITPKAKEYFNHLRDKFNLPLYYQSFDLSTGHLSEIT
ncbi:hypothetical protein [Pedobacter sp. AJM]|uniref:hypothetical protein n=1 Tax=Pedobacter sp. AJM TaxID=2003629 RepID=UPI000B4BB099|nr:hypothetical protein [Pedobacter sp. AJM]OWK69211.1 hypothetical protein CBW18_18135 [Pedobacter sp. AJM]